MGMIREFKEFALKGNMIELAVGVILALVFGKVVNSFVSDILMPPIGMLLGGLDFSVLSFNLPAKGSLPPVEIKYGLFIDAVVNFLIISFAIFLAIKGMNKLRSKPEKAVPTIKECPQCLMTVPAKAKKCGHCCSSL